VLLRVQSLHLLVGFWVLFADAPFAIGPLQAGVETVVFRREECQFG
jgi:hypothetical protein